MSHKFFDLHVVKASKVSNVAPWLHWMKYPVITGCKTLEFRLATQVSYITFGGGIRIIDWMCRLRYDTSQKRIRLSGEKKTLEAT